MKTQKAKRLVRKVTLFKQLLQLLDEAIQQYICNFGPIVDKLAETGVTLQMEWYILLCYLLVYRRLTILQNYPH